MSDTFLVSEQETDLRLDKLLALRFPQQSRTYFQFLIEQGCVLINGSLLKKREKLNAGDEVEICFLLTSELNLEPENIPLNILYEDEHLIAIHKPAGMVVHPAPGNPNHTFANALLYHCKKLEGPFETLRPGIVHRLDKDTSGVLIAAKTYETHQKLVTQFARREIKKTYLGICTGNPGSTTISAPIKRHPIHRQKMSISEDGKEATTHIKVLAEQNNLFFVQAQPVTGRTHQIRVHLKSRNAPILGDLIYGSSSKYPYEVKRQMLHAYQLELKHPIIENSLKFQAPVPEDMKEILNKLKILF